VICGYGILYIIYCEASHFALSATVGLLVYWLTLTILSHITGSQDLIPDSSIYRYSLVVALCFAVATHIHSLILVGLIRL